MGPFRGASGASLRGLRPHPHPSPLEAQPDPCHCKNRMKGLAGFPGHGKQDPTQDLPSYGHPAPFTHPPFTGVCLDPSSEQGWLRSRTDQPVSAITWAWAGLAHRQETHPGSPGAVLPVKSKTGGGVGGVGRDTPFAAEFKRIPQTLRFQGNNILGLEP